MMEKHWLFPSLFYAMITIPALAASRESAGSPAEEIEMEDLLQLENAQAEFAGEESMLEKEHESRITVLRYKNRKLAARMKARASRKGDLELALAWERFEKELAPDSTGKPAEEKEEEKEKETDAEEDVPGEILKARTDLAKEQKKLMLRHNRMMRDLRAKHRKIAGREKTAATRKGKLKLAKAWEEFETGLAPLRENLALNAKVTASAQLGKYSVQNMIDGNATPRRAWYGGYKARKPHWARFALGSPKAVWKVRFLTTVGTRWSGAGYEPLSYDILIKQGSSTRSKVSVRGGNHPGRELSENGKTQWIEMDLKKRVEANIVEFHCHKTSGKDRPPFIFEFEILGED